MCHAHRPNAKGLYGVTTKYWCNHAYIITIVIPFNIGLDCSSKPTTMYPASTSAKLFDKVIGPGIVRNQMIINLTR